MGNNDIFMAKYSAFNPYRLRQRDMGFQTPIGAEDALAKSLYCGMKPIASWSSDSTKCMPTGGVFNLEFSPEGSLLVAACEKKAIQIFDPLTHQRIHSVLGAHIDCVNCVKFLDGRMFATCSDDTTIALWDVRNLKRKIRSLQGHSKWVKNIEFSVKDKLLVTSGLDGSIFTWDINSYTESNLVYQRVFHTSSLMRCRLSPDAKQMVMCTTGGLLIIIHDLNLSTLAQDLCGFKPSFYRLMQRSMQLFPVAAKYDHLFDANRKENRLEFVSDFPDGNDAEVVSSLQIHPHGWSALSRNISHDDKSEWTCIHDIQPLRDDECPGEGPRPRRPAPRRRPRPRRPHTTRWQRSRSHSETEDMDTEPSMELDSPIEPDRPIELNRPIELDRPIGPERQLEQVGQPERQSPSELPRHSRDSSEERDQPEAGPSRPRVALLMVETLRMTPRVRGRAGGAGASQARAASPPAAPAAPARIQRVIQNDVWEAAIKIKQHRILQEIYSRSQVRPNFHMHQISGVNSGIAPPPPCDHPPDRPSTSGHSPRVPSLSEEARAAATLAVRQNRRRLLYYTEETNEGRGFIKELCYSADGRVVCSPFGRGMRLLALNQYCGDMAHSQPLTGVSKPRAMVEVGQSLGIHQDLVVSSRFSPRYHLLVTGCLGGKVVWYQPYSGEALY